MKLEAERREPPGIHRNARKSGPGWLAPCRCKAIHDILEHVLMPDPSFTTNARIRCPACRASQKRQDQCRRCGADLRLLVRIRQHLDWLQHRYLQSLQTNHPWQAAALLAEIRQIDPTTARRIEQTGG